MKSIAQFIVFATVLTHALVQVHIVQAQAAPKTPTEAAGFKKPNIIFIMADDLGYGDLGCYGQKLIKTPNIDRLAREGMRFTQCYAGSTVCAPSRSVLMTGLHAGHTRVRGNFGKGGVVGLGGGKGRVPLEAGDVTVAEVLKGAGYRTALTGKWGLGEPETSGHPRLQGFGQWLGYLNQRRAHEHYPQYIWLNEAKLPLRGNRDGKQQQHTHDRFADFMINFVRVQQGPPFFLYVPFCVPHAKLQVPDLEPYLTEPWSQEEKTYAAMITRMDEDIGDLLKLLKQKRIERDTIIFFCSDNGAANRYEGRFDSSGPLRGRKRDLTEGGLRVPMVVHWPGKIKPGVVNETVWSFTDFMATAAELAQVQPPANDGQSLVPVLLGAIPEFKPRFLYWEFFEKGFQQAARWGSWKVIRPGVGEDLELYNLEADLGETKDVAKDNPEVVKRFEEYLRGARTESAEWPVNLNP